jgi:hypothetical protein
MLEPATLAELRKNVDALNNRAIFEIPEMLDRLMRESAGTPESRMGAENLQTVR